MMTQISPEQRFQPDTNRNRRLMATAVIGELAFANDTVPLMRAYAAKVGADFDLTSDFPEEVRYGGCLYYITIEILRRFAVQSHYRELLLIDADVVVTPEAPDIFEELKEGKIGMTADNCTPLHGDHFKNWLENNIGSLEAYRPGRAYLNAGIIVVGLEAARRLNFDGPYPNCPWYDQDWLNHRIIQSGLGVTLLDGRWNHWPEGRTLQDLEEGYFLHFVGPRKEFIQRYVSRLESRGGVKTTIEKKSDRTFLILCRSPSPQTGNLMKVLENFGEVMVISDEPSDDPKVSHIADEAMEGFVLLNHFEGQRKAVTAWERAWKHLSETVGGMTGAVWLVEDDVAGNAEYWSELIASTEEVNADFSAFDIRTWEEDRDWAHWTKGSEFFRNLARSFNPLCRISGRLALCVLEFRRHHGRFCFLEILFASLVREHGMSLFDWKKNETTADITTDFRFRPPLDEVGLGICHPVKDARLHGRICARSD